MEDTSTKAIGIAVSVTVTMVIVSLVVASFTKIKEVYRLTKNTDVAIHSQFDNLYLTYDGKEITGMGLLNTVRKFEHDKELVEAVEYPGRSNITYLASSYGRRESEQLKLFLDQNKRYGGITYRYSNRYKIKVEQVNYKIVMKITAK